MASLFRAGVGVVFLLSLSACGDVAWNDMLVPKNIPRQVAFNEADFAGTKGVGSGAVRGQVYLQTVADNSQMNAANTRVVLMPVTAYTTEIVQRKYGHGVFLAKADPRFAQYVRATQTDENGNFEFRHLPPGHYYVGCKFFFPHSEVDYDADDNEVDINDTHYRREYLEVEVKSGQTVSIGDWQTGPERVVD